mgnify:CR=1 FL=1
MIVWASCGAHLKMDRGFWKYFLSNMGVKQGVPLYPTLFGPCISKLEYIVNKVAKEEESYGPKLIHKFFYTSIC